MRRQRGAIIKRGRRYAVKYRDGAGVQRWGGTFDTKGEAQDELNKTLAAINAGTYTPRTPVLFEKFAQEWIAARLRIRGSTESGYGSLIKRQLAPRLGKLRVCDLHLAHVQKLVSDMLADGRTGKTVHNAVTLLRTMLIGRRGASAMRLGYIGHDPTLGLDLPANDTSPIVPPTEEQVWKLIDAAREIGGTEYAAVYIGAFTGLRRNELLAARFTDVDWFTKEIRIERAVSKAKATDDVHKWAWVIGPPKSRKSRRRVALTESVLQLLAGLKRVAADPEGYILPGDAGAFIDPDSFDAEVWVPIPTKAELARVRFHDLRHFFASMLIAQGESPAYVRDQMGHSSIQVTFDTYGHLFPQARQEATDRYEEAMQKARPKRSQQPAEDVPGPIGSSLVADPEKDPRQKARGRRAN
jgi:integrase